MVRTARGIALLPSGRGWKVEGGKMPSEAQEVANAFKLFSIAASAALPVVAFS
jgi:hypothetical protein